MPRSSPVAGFRLAYDRQGSGPPVVLLHGWPGDRADYRQVMALLSDSADVVVPDLRGFGESDKHPEPAARAYSAAAQARSVVGLIEELDLQAPVIGGYDVGSRIAQTIARRSPGSVHSWSRHHCPAWATSRPSRRRGSSPPRSATLSCAGTRAAVASSARRTSSRPARRGWTRRPSRTRP